MGNAYKISALGIAPGHIEQTVRAGLENLLKGDPAAFEPKFQRILLNQQVVLVQNISETKARQLHAKLTAIGFICRTDPMELSLETKLYLCPACGNEQEYATDGTPDTCEKCGVIGDRFKDRQTASRQQEMQRALELERRALAAQTAVANDKQTYEADRKKQAKLRKLARRQAEKELGITFWTKLRPYLAPKVLLPTLLGLGLLGGSVGFVLWDQVMPDAKTAKTTPLEGQPGKMQLVITPPPGLSVTVGASPELAGDPGIGGTSAGGALDQELASATGQAISSVVDQAIANGRAAASDSQVVSGQTIPETLNQPALQIHIPKQTTNVTESIRSDTQVLANLAFYQLATGELGEAAKTLDRITLALSANDASAKPADRLLYDAAIMRAGLASAYAKRNDMTTANSQWRRANLLADSIAAPEFRAMAYSGLAHALHETPQLTAQKDYLNLATATAARSAGEPLARVDLLSTLARDSALTGQRQQAGTFFEKAKATAKKIKDPVTQPVAQSILAQHFAEAGETETAAAILASSTQSGTSDAASYHRVEALAALALGHFQQGKMQEAQADVTAAMTQSSSLIDPVERTASLIALARTIFNTGDPATAKQIIAAVDQ